jgi:hypothetical protein
LVARAGRARAEASALTVAAGTTTNHSPKEETCSSRTARRRVARAARPARLSDSPLAIRRGNADPTEIDDTPLTLGFSERHDYENTMKPEPPIEATGAGEK